MPEYSIVFAGRVGVGKSSLFSRLQHGVFSEYSDKTGTRRWDMGLENFVYETTVNGKEVKATLWDTGGFERYDSMTSNYYRYCQAVILVYDLDAEETLYCLRDWLNEARRNSRWPEKIVFSVWGNKSDLDEQSTKQEAVKAFIQEYNIPDSLNFKVSAKTNENVDEALLTVIKAIDDNFSSLDPLEASQGSTDTQRLTLSADPSVRRRHKKRKCC